MKAKVLKKLNILADAAKYDVSCSSSGSSRAAAAGEGTTKSAGICHSFTEDGRCISLLKILYTNHCIYDCAYCVNRRSNDKPRASFTVEELADLTIHFYRRNYIEGLFLSSGVLRNPDYTMEQLNAVARKLRNGYRFNGYIHMKAIPGADPLLVHEAGLLADRLSVNIEIPTEKQLIRLAPEKDFASVYRPMNQISQQMLISKEERKKYRHSPRFTPAGQSTQLIVGATPETDYTILKLASGLYSQQKLKRVYYSGFVPVNAHDKRLPVLKQPPLVRENRLYQADWLMRFYHFRHNEILDENHTQLDQQVDPKLAYALRNPHLYPVDLDKATYEEILRVPGIGVRSAKIIVANRRYGSITVAYLKKMGVAVKRARYFILCRELPQTSGMIYPEQIRKRLVRQNASAGEQLTLF